MMMRLLALSACGSLLLGCLARDVYAPDSDSTEETLAINPAPHLVEKDGGVSERGGDAGLGAGTVVHRPEPAPLNAEEPSTTEALQVPETEPKTLDDDSSSVEQPEETGLPSSQEKPLELMAQDAGASEPQESTSGDPGDNGPEAPEGASCGVDGRAEDVPRSSVQECSGAPVLPVILDHHPEAGYEIETLTADTNGTQLHVVSVYETLTEREFRTHPQGSATIEYALEDDGILVLHSYEPVHWTINVSDGARLQKVIALGYHWQCVSAPEDVEVEVQSYEQGASLPSTLTGGGGSCIAPNLIDYIEPLTGTTVSSFNCTYVASQFQLLGNCAE